MNLILPEKNRSDLDDSQKWCEFKMKSVTASTFSPSICREVMGPDAMICVF